MADQVSGLKELFDKRLPVNRKERYYTGTVLPMIVASDGFKRLPKFLTLCGVTTDLALRGSSSGVHQRSVLYRVWFPRVAEGRCPGPVRQPRRQ